MKEGIPQSIEKSPWRLRALNKVFVETYVSRVEVKGLEILDRLPPEKKKIIVTTHISDFDMPIILNALGDRLDLLVGDMSPHHDPRQDPQGFASNILAGPGNFSKIDFKADKSAGIFNPENFKDIEETVDRTDKSVLIAAHNPAKGAELPDKGGYGAAYLASILDNAVIIPVAVSLRSKNPVGLASEYADMLKERPEAEVTIGEPIELAQIVGAETLARLMEKRKKEALSQEERDEMRQVLQELRVESGQIMERLAAMLPEEKRGKWNTTESETREG